MWNLTYCNFYNLTFSDSIKLSNSFLFIKVNKLSYYIHLRLKITRLNFLTSDSDTLWLNQNIFYSRCLSSLFIFYKQWEKNIYTTGKVLFVETYNVDEYMPLIFMFVLCDLYSGVVWLPMCITEGGSLPHSGEASHFHTGTLDRIAFGK
jgi:hypothetical protein